MQPTRSDPGTRSGKDSPKKTHLWRKKRRICPRSSTAFLFGPLNAHHSSAQGSAVALVFMDPGRHGVPFTVAMFVCVDHQIPQEHEVGNHPGVPTAGFILI